MKLILQKLVKLFDTFLSESLGLNLDVKLDEINQSGSVDSNKLICHLGDFIAALQEYEITLKKQIDEEVDCDFVDVELTEEETKVSAHVQGNDAMVVMDTDVISDADSKIQCGSNSAQSEVSMLQPVNCHTTDFTDKTERQEENDREKVNANIVQIQAPKSEIERRILAFIEQKRMEVDEHNRKEFCSSLYTESDTDDSCARVDSLFVSRVGGKSHIKVSRVVNLQGPQTQISSELLSPYKNKTEVTDSFVDSGVEERLHNMETHLRIKPGTSLTKSEIFDRLKKLEERILYLESLSPEYFHIPPPKRQKTERKQERDYIQQEQEMSLSEIDRKMQELKEVLRNRVSDG